MNTRTRRLSTEFASPTRFELTPAPAKPFRASERTRFERLEQSLLAEWLARAPGAGVHAALRRAANEAAALAWRTAFPLLVFPALLEELVGAALGQIQHQPHAGSCRGQEFAAIA